LKRGSAIVFGTLASQARFFLLRPSETRQILSKHADELGEPVIADAEPLAMGKAIRIGETALPVSSGQISVGPRSELDHFVEGLKAYRSQHNGDREKLVAAFSLALRLIKVRRRREMIFGAKLFGEPVWDMLLDLFVENLRQKPVSVSSLCIASAVPLSTALRWIDSMEEAGLCKRFPDPDDGRRAFVGLTLEAMDAMVNMLGDPGSDARDIYGELVDKG
jgi:DNA-binding MarR family transcriptional regulator